MYPSHTRHIHTLDYYIQVRAAKRRNGSIKPYTTFGLAMNNRETIGRMVKQGDRREENKEKRLKARQAAMIRRQKNAILAEKDYQKLIRTINTLNTNGDVFTEAKFLCAGVCITHSTQHTCVYTQTY